MDKQPTHDQTEQIDEPLPRGEQGMPPTDGVAKESPLETVVQRRFAASVPSSPAASVTYPFLSPPQAEGELGRLGDYRIVQLLGEGGMGFVFRGEDLILRRDVALKVMRPEAAAKPQAAERFLREGRAAAGLKSDHIITIYQVGQANGVPFIAMEFLNGLPLDLWFRKQTAPVPLTHALRIVRDTLRGLATAHEKGLIHRDIKPANLWLEKETSRVKVLDFGLTRSQDSSDQVTADGAVVGTPAYMAPEQAGGKAVDLRADLFSVGTVMYQLLAGINPFVRDHTMGTLGAVMYEGQPSLSSVRGDVPMEYSNFVDRLLAKDPNQRPANAKEALAELVAIEKRLRDVTPTAMIPAPDVVPIATHVGAPIVQPTEVWGELTDDTAAEATPAQRPTPKRARRSRAPMLLVAGALVALVVFIIGGIITIIANKDGPKPTTEPHDQTVENKEITKPFTPVIPKKDTPLVAMTPDRRAAEYAFSVGGHVRLNGSLNAVDNLIHVAQLPKEPFRLTSVSLSTKAVTNQGLANFKDTKNLQEITLRELPNITAEGLLNFQDNKEIEMLDFWGSNGFDDAALAVFRHSKKLKGVNFGECSKLTDVGIGHLQGCRSLKFLNLSSCSKITDACLSLLGDCHELTELNFDGCELVTDRGLAAFRQFTSIRYFRANGTKITNAYLENFRQWPNLQILSLASTAVTDDGFAHLRDCTRLISLDITGTTCNDKTLAILVNIPELLNLHLGGTKVSDQGMAVLRQGKKIQFVSLQNTAITDQGLVALHEVADLIGVELNGTKVTAQGVKDLHAKKPMCRIQWDGGVLEPKP